ncbi:MAG: adenylate kinase [Rikenellaceae bacterium]|nr:adenylate kinase [Rikenellaceae bacterium]MCL2691852.1 adenylate kinase [Rikenellaceae bacterium]
MLNIVLFGPPGAGKGTQATMLVNKYGFEHISTGQVIRDEIRLGTKIGRSVKERIEHGELASDEVVVELVADFVERHRESSHGNIYDGFPRTTVQAEEFDKTLEAHGLCVDVMLSLEVPEEVLIERLLRRGAESGRADDFSIEVIRNRLDIYNRQTAIVADYYCRQGKHIIINGLGSVEEVFERLCSEIDKLVPCPICHNPVI